MARNKVIFAGETLIDLTADTVTPAKMLSGTTAHNAAGERITGTAALFATESQSGEKLEFESVMGGVAFTDERGLRVVGKTAQASSTGKNLASQDVVTGSLWYTSGLYTSMSGYTRVMAIDVKPNTTYTLSSNLPLSTAYVYSVFSSTSPVHTLYGSDDTVYTFTTPGDEGISLLKITLAGENFEWVQVEEKYQFDPESPRIGHKTQYDSTNHPAIIENGIVYNSGVTGHTSGGGLVISNSGENQYTITATLVSGTGDNVQIVETDTLENGVFGEMVTIGYFKPSLLFAGGINVRITKKYFVIFLIGAEKRALAIRDIRINLVTTNTPFESYTGGVPAPTPEYPMPIRCVKAGTVVRCRGKNLYDYRQVGDTRAGVTYTPTQDGVLVNGTATGMSFPLLLDVTEVLAVGKTYVISANHNALYPRIRITKADGAETSAIRWTVDGSETKIEAYFYCNAGATFDDFLAKVQLEEGDSATAYEPYTAPHTITTPCDLYEGDVWYPASGRVERNWYKWELTGNETFTLNASRTSDTKLCSYVAIPNKTAIEVSGYESIAYASHISKISYADASNSSGSTAATTAVAISPNSQAFYIGITTDHIGEATVGALTEWLAAQHEAGTPVAILYKISPTAEQYTPQPLPAAAGTVIVEQEPIEESATLGMTVVLQ